MSQRGEEIDLLKYHPELVLISKSPYTFEGFLSVPVNCNYHGRTLIKVKLIVPLYPKLKDIAIFFAKNFDLSLNSDFTKLILNSLRNRISLNSFLNHLKEYFALQMKHDCNYNCTHSESNLYESMKSRLDELKELLLKSSEIKILSNQNLNIIKLTVNDISVVVQSKGNLWKVINSEIPNFFDDKSVESTGLPLNRIVDNFNAKINSLKPIWVELNEIDMNCWVMDPIHPKPHHLYRRIYLSDLLSLMVTLDSRFLQGIPNVKLLGCESEVSKYYNDIRMELWDTENSLLENLRLLLNIDNFPQAPTKENNDIDFGLVHDEECCICYEKELDNNVLPNVLCNNIKCRKNFHLQCLRQWLETVNGKTNVFKQITGECPCCRQNIMCPLT